MLLSEFDQGRYHTYPHANGFADGGRSIVLGQRVGTAASLWKIDLATRQETCVAEFTTSQKELWFDIAADASVLVTVADNVVWLIDLTSGETRPVYCDAGPRELYAIPSIRRDGQVVVVGHHGDTRHGVLRIDVASGEAKPIVEHAWLTGHPHLMPHDPAWISYCHEGRTDTIPDRMWAWHPEHAPQGRRLWDHGALNLCVGHEVASRHAASVLAVTYGVSPGTPRGLYEIFVDGRPPRLISEGNRDLHGNFSPDGRLAVVDTSGPHDEPGKGWENANGRSDILLIDCATGRRKLLARTAITSHPWHPHPVFTPDGMAIVYGEGSGDTGRVHLITLPQPAAFS